MLIANKRVRLRKTAVLQRDTSSAKVMKFACQKTRIVEIPEAAIAVNQDRQLG